MTSPDHSLEAREDVMKVKLELSEALAEQIVRESRLPLADAIVEILKKNKDKIPFSEEKLIDIVSRVVYSTLRSFTSEIVKRVEEKCKVDPKFVKDLVRSELNGYLGEVKGKLEKLPSGDVVSVEKKLVKLEKQLSEVLEDIQTFKKTMKQSFTKFKNDLTDKYIEHHLYTARIEKRLEALERSVSPLFKLDFEIARLKMEIENLRDLILELRAKEDKCCAFIHKSFEE